MMQGSGSATARSHSSTTRAHRVAWPRDRRAGDPRTTAPRRDRFPGTSCATRHAECADDLVAAIDEHDPVDVVEQARRTFEHAAKHRAHAAPDASGSRTRERWRASRASDFGHRDQVWRQDLAAVRLIDHQHGADRDVQELAKRATRQVQALTGVVLRKPRAFESSATSRSCRMLVSV